MNLTDRTLQGKISESENTYFFNFKLKHRENKDQKQ